MEVYGMFWKRREELTLRATYLTRVKPKNVFPF